MLATVRSMRLRWVGSARPREGRVIVGELAGDSSPAGGREQADPRSLQAGANRA